MYTRNRRNGVQCGHAAHSLDPEAGLIPVAYASNPDGSPRMAWQRQDGTLGLSAKCGGNPENAKLNYEHNTLTLSL